MSGPGRPARRRRPKEVFIGPRLAVAVRAPVRARSAVVLVGLSVLAGMALASGLAAAIWYLVRAVFHAGGGP